MIKLGSPYPVRKEMINRLLSSNHFEYEKPLKFGGDTKLYKVYSVSIHMPKYRLANGRTQAPQEEYLSIHQDKPADFFSRDLESEEVHRVQHEILKSMLKDKGIDLMKYFENEKQDDPLIIDDDGFVINGNRRLCAMRELYESNKQKYEHFSNIYVLILPPCEDEKKDALEARLQIMQDIKSDYIWTSEACMYRARQKKYGYNDEELGLLYEMKASEMREKLDVLAYGEKYLESRGKVKRYSDILDAEFAFKKIREGRIKNSNKNEIEKSIFENISFILIDDPKGNGMGIVYRAIGDVANSLDKIVEQLIDELPIDDYRYSEEVDEDTDLFSTGSETTEHKINLGKLSLAIDDTNNKDKIIESVKDVIEREKILQSDKQKAIFVLKQVRKAHSLLTDAINGFNENTMIDGISDQLDAIENLVNELRGKVS